MVTVGDQVRLAFLPEDPRNCQEGWRHVGRRAVATGVHEENTVHIGGLALRVIDGGLSAAS